MTGPAGYRFRSAAVACQPWIGPLRLRVEEVLALPAGWNGEGSSPVDPSAVRHALTVIDELGSSEEPWLVPLPNGHVQLEWFAGDVVVEVPPAGSTVRVFVGDRPAIEPALGERLFELGATIVGRRLP